MFANKQLIIDYKQTFATDSGKRVLADLRRRCPMLTEAIDATKGVDVNRILIEEGRRSVVLHIYKMLKLDPNEERQTRAITQGEYNER